MRAAASVLAASVAALVVLSGPASAQPNNDDFAGATPVVTLPSFDAVDVTEATIEPGEPDQDCAPTASTVWYALTLDSETTVAVDTAGSDYDTVVGVYSGTELGDLELVACNDDVLGLQARAVFAAEADTTYFVQVAAFEELFEGGQLEIAFRGSTPGAVTCDAEAEELEDFFSLYFVAPGDTVACVATALDPAQPAAWQVEFIDYEQDLTLDAVGADGLQPDPDGVVSFSFTVPDDVEFGEFLAVVTQGEAGAETYWEPVFGLIEGEVIDPELDCQPDPVTRGDIVECAVTQLRRNGEFFWVAEFLDAEEAAEPDLLLDDVDDTPWDMTEGEGLVEEFDEFSGEVDSFLVDEFEEGSGEADEDGVGQLGFGVPEAEDIVAYRVQVFSDTGGFAVYEGTIDAPVIVPEAPDPTEESPGPTPVLRPTRIDTGAGGATGAVPGSEGGLPRLAFVGLALVALCATGPMRRAARG